MTNPEKFLKFDFWALALDKAASWFIESGPSLVIILIGAWSVLRISRGLLRRVETTLNDKNGEPDETKKLEQQKRVHTLIGIISSTVKFLILGIMTLLVLRELGVDIAPIIAGAGVLGLAVGFGAQNLVKDVISGFFILIENQIRTGDVVEINGTGGLVESINLRTTVLRDLTGTVHVFPNGSITQVSNKTKDWSAYVFDIGVSYDADVNQVMDLLKKIDDEIQKDREFSPLLVSSMEVFGLDQFGDSAVVIKARIKTKPGQQWTVGREYHRRIKMTFDQEGVEIPFPQRTLHVAPNALDLLKK